MKKRLAKASQMAERSTILAEAKDEKLKRLEETKIKFGRRRAAHVLPFLLRNGLT